MALQLIAVSLASSVIPDPEQLDHRAPIPTQEEPVAASRADRLTDLPTLEELLAAHPTRALYPSPAARGAWRTSRRLIFA